MATNAESAGEREPSPTATVVPLKYVARAGLLPELTRQTYDSLYKALREAILNSIDAGASHINIDLSAVENDRVLELRDDGSGMSLSELQQSFMSLGGSTKFASADKFGRIGIGSLALMHYASAVYIETKQRGSRSVTKAIVSHPWTLDQEQRAQELADLLAGEAWEEPTQRARQDHYTVIRLEGVNDILVEECGDVTAYYALLEQLRRILPLKWPETRLSNELERHAPELAALIEKHSSLNSTNVMLQSRWSEDDVLTKRVYGDGGSQEEEWDGKPKAILQKLTVEEGSGSRDLILCGYLLSQARPSPEWAGLIARVQNVAVEEHTFFDLESDPGFRKYITGEVWLLGDLDRSHLVNIDRASFNHESRDYRAVSRTMQTEINEFKSAFVQAPRRAKVAVKRRLEQQVNLVASLTRVADASQELLLSGAQRKHLPSSNNGTIRSVRSRALVDDLVVMGALVGVEAHWVWSRPYRLRVADDGRRVLVEVDARVAQPHVRFCGREYSLVFVEGRATDPPIIVTNRPRQLIFNFANPCFDADIDAGKAATVLALEVGYLAGDRTADDLYDRVLTLMRNDRASGASKTGS